MYKDLDAATGAVESFVSRHPDEVEVRGCRDRHLGNVR